MKRYNAVVGGVYDPSVMVEENDGDYVWWEDVEAQCAELESKCAELLDALERCYNIMNNGGTWSLEDQAAARAAIAKAKGETP